MLQDAILIVDDEADLRLPLQDTLRADGYNVESAESASMALEMIGKQHFAVILTDLHMPGGPSGLELITALKVRDPEALCVVITGYASLDVSVGALKSGAYDFVQKPFKLPEIEAVLDRALDHARLRQELKAYQRNLEQQVVARTQEVQALHAEVLCLNGILLEVQGVQDEKELLTPFFKYLQTRLAPDGCALFIPGEGKTFHRELSVGSRPWFPASRLPKLTDLQGSCDWGWADGYPEGYLIPLRLGQEVLAVLYLGFEGRSSFHADDPAFVFWCSQVQAALHGLRCTRARVSAELAKART